MKSKEIKSPLVSIVIPIYNHEKYIIECLDSIKLEKYSNLEVLMLDDGSFDNSYEIAKDWILHNHQYFAKIEIEKQKNKGVAKAVNSLIMKSKGNYIIPMASDDKLIPGMIAKRVEILANDHLNLALFTDCKVIDEFSSEISKSAIFNFRKSDKYAFYSKNSIENEIIMNWIMPGPIIMFKREVFFGVNSIGFYNEDGATEDREFFMRLISRGVLKFSPIVVSEYRMHTNNSCRPVARESKIDHYRMRLMAELIGLELFKGPKRLFLRFSILRFKNIILWLETNKIYFFIYQLFCGLIMRSIYYLMLIKNRFHYFSNKLKLNI